jgi:hypothetical protein
MLLGLTGSRTQRYWILATGPNSDGSYWVVEPNSVGHGLHDFVTTYLSELPVSPSVLLAILLFVRQSFTKSSFLVAWWID